MKASVSVGDREDVFWEGGARAGVVRGAEEGRWIGQMEEHTLVTVQTTVVAVVNSEQYSPVVESETRLRGRQSPLM